MKIPTGLLKANARVAAQLAELDLDDALVIVLNQVETMGLADLEGWRLFLDRRRKRTGTGPEQDRNERGARPEQDRNRTGTGPEDFRSNSARPEFGGPQGGSGSGSSLNSDPDLSVSLSGSSPKLSSPEGGPDDTDGHAGWGLSDQPRPVELPVVIPVAPPPAPANEPPRRYNPVAIVDAFAAGVGGVWTCGQGKPLTDLSRALQPHLVQGKAPVLEHARSLGARWATFCGGFPDDAWKAAAWLGKGAPGPTSGQRGASAARDPTAPRRCERCSVPTTYGRVCAMCRRDLDREAEDRERGVEAARADGPIVALPAVAARLAGLFEPPPVERSRLDSPEVQEQLRRLERAAGDGS